MSLGSFFKKLIKTEAPSSRSPSLISQLPSPTSEAPVRPSISYPAKPRPIAPVPEPVPISPPPAATPAAKLAEDDAHTVELLRELMDTLAKDDKSVLRVSCKAVLVRVPEENRGPLWNAETFPEGLIELPRDTLMGQLKSGCIRYPYTQFSDVIPEGWIVGVTASTALEFDLGEVVPAIPPEWFEITSKIDEDMLDVAGMHDYFAPGANPASLPPESTAPAAPSEPPPVVPVQEKTPEPTAEPLVPPRPTETTIEQARGILETLLKSQAARTTVESQPVEQESHPEIPLSAEPVPVPSAPVKEAPLSVPVGAPLPAEPSKEAEVPVPPTSLRPPVVTESPVRPAEKTTDGEWDGTEPSLDAGVNAVNLSTAGLDDLQTLDGVGPAMARAILAYREQLGGRFQSIFELADVPGVGPKHFQRMTGLDLNLRFNRHEVLRDALKIEAGQRATLPQITRLAETRLAVRHCILTTVDGLPLAWGSADEATASSFGALVPQLFQRTRRYLNTLTHDSVQVLALPMADPPLLLFGGRDIFMVLLLNPGAPIDPVLSQAHFLARELDWLLGSRAVVRNS